MFDLLIGISILVLVVFDYFVVNRNFSMINGLVYRYVNTIKTNLSQVLLPVANLIDMCLFTLNGLFGTFLVTCIYLGIWYLSKGIGYPLMINYYIIGMTIIVDIILIRIKEGHLHQVTVGNQTFNYTG